MKIAYTVQIATQGYAVEWGEGLEFSFLMIASDLPEATLKSELLCAEIRETLTSYPFFREYSE